MDSVKINILRCIYGNSKYNHVLTLFDNISSYDYNGIEFEYRLADKNGHTSITEYLKTNTLNLKKIEYNDDIIITYKPFIPLKQSNIIFRKYNNSQLCERKVLITKIIPDNQEVEIPLILKVSCESPSTVDFYTDIFNYQRRQRISYKFIETELCDWRIDKTVRFITEDKNSKKLTYSLSEDNVINPKYYDILDVEIEYIGNLKNIYKSSCKLFEKLYPTKFKILNSIYNKIQNQLKLNLSKTFPKVSIINNDIINNNSIKDFIIMEKLDGERCSIIKYGESIYELNSLEFKCIYSNGKNNIKSINIPIYKNKKHKKITIIDAEKINNEYYLFDILYYESKNINDKTFIERYKYLEIFKTKNVNELNNIKIVPYKIEENWNICINWVNIHNKSEIFNNINIDGLICRKNDSTFNTTEIYKLKNKKLSTIDFKICWIEEKRLYHLYLIGNIESIIKKIAFLTKYSKNHFGYSLLEKPDAKNVYILFDSPFHNKMFQFIPKITYQLDNILLKNMYEEPLKFNNSIVEMSWEYDHWIPLKIRKDKLYPNGYKVGLSTISLLFDKLIYKEIVDNNKWNQKILIIAEDVNNIIVKYLIELLLNNLGTIDILYMFDTVKYMKNFMSCCSIDNFYAISTNKNKLTKIVDITSNIKKQMNNNILLPKTNIYQFKNINLNCIHTNIDLNNSDIIEKLLKGIYYTQKSISIIWCDIIEKYCDSYAKLIHLRNAFYKILNNNGKVILFYIDGEKILNGESFNTFNEIIECSPKYKNILHYEDNIYFNDKILDGFYNVLGITNFSYEYDESIISYNKVIISKNRISPTILQEFYYDNIYIYINYDCRYNNKDKEFLNQKIYDLLNNNLYYFKQYMLPNISKNKYSRRNIIIYKHIAIFENLFNMDDIIEPLTVDAVKSYISRNEKYINIDSIDQFQQLYKCVVFSKNI